LKSPPSNQASPFNNKIAGGSGEATKQGEKVRPEITHLMQAITVVDLNGDIKGNSEVDAKRSESGEIELAISRTDKDTI
jgi:hypothetical protein